MKELEIFITSWYSLDGNFEHYYVDYLVDGGEVDYLQGDIAPRRFAGTFGFGREIADYFLLEYNFSGKDRPNVTLDLWSGFHPIENCSSGCLHVRYTKKPDKSLLKELTEII